MIAAYSCSSFPQSGILMTINAGHAFLQTIFISFSFRYRKVKMEKVHVAYSSPTKNNSEQLNKNILLDIYSLDWVSLSKSNFQGNLLHSEGDISWNCQCDPFRHNDISFDIFQAPWPPGLVLLPFIHLLKHSPYSSHATLLNLTNRDTQKQKSKELQLVCNCNCLLGKKWNIPRWQMLSWEARGAGRESPHGFP